MESLPSQTNKCNNCGAEVGQLVNGSVRCPYCGSIFHYNHDPSHATPATSAIQPGSVPAAQSNPASPVKKPRSRHPYFWGFFIWVMYAVLRALLFKASGSDFSAGSEVYDNILISPLFGPYWVLRAILLTVFFPSIFYFYYRNKK